MTDQLRRTRTSSVHTGISTDGFHFHAHRLFSFIHPLLAGTLQVHLNRQHLAINPRPWWIPTEIIRFRGGIREVGSGIAKSRTTNRHSGIPGSDLLVAGVNAARSRSDSDDIWYHAFRWLTSSQCGGELPSCKNCQNAGVACVDGESARLRDLPRR